MVFFKALASLGVGAATIDTKLEGTQFFPGDTVNGEVFIRGGQAEQQVDEIYLYLVVDISKNDKKTAHVLKSYHLSTSFLIEANGSHSVPFKIKLPLETPMSSGAFPVYLKTGLDIKMAIDPSDTDRIEVLPTPYVQKVLQQFEDAGFVLYQIHNEFDDQCDPPFFQMLKYKPTGSYHGFVDEMIIYINHNGNEVNMDVEMNRSARFLRSNFHWSIDDPEGTLHVNDEHIYQDPVDKIQDMLNRKTLS
ncbi:sporulation protein [Hazenella coriacea]|uniref:Sporulation-control protein n=1 Tax=Hazenella coriacea TaxID=1179467 RepID=A0A4V6NZ73_9BACL|nr:sporulation protein [Hazenella coriacea]TCS92830.1 sporulation-control protein [Hazenella coriacea]